MNTRRILTLLLLAGTAISYAAEQADKTSPGDELPATHYVELKFESGSCDDINQRLILGNRHPFRTAMITVRWRAEGGKELTQQFFRSPDSEAEIGCAVTAAILEAAFVDF